MEEGKTIETIKDITLKMEWHRTVDPYAYQSRGRAGMAVVTRIGAVLMVGKIRVGGYEFVRDSNKPVIVRMGTHVVAKVANEEDARAYLLSQV